MDTLMYTALVQDPHSPVGSESGVDGPQVYDAEYMRINQQRVLDTISMQLNHLQLPINVAPTKVPSKLNFSFLPQNMKDFDQGSSKQNVHRTTILEQHLHSSQIEEFTLSGQLKSTTLAPKTGEFLANWRKQSADGDSKSDQNSKSEQRSKANLLATSFDEKRKISQDAVSTDFLKVLKSSSEVLVNQAINSPTNGSIKSAKSSYSFQHQKNCKCEDLLVVDDNDFNVLALKEMLESFQFRVAKAYNGEIAINLIKEKAKNECCNAFQIVFMDCDMPVKDGFEATKDLRELQKKKQLPSFPIIAVTAFVNEREVNRCFEVGMDEYLNKPVKKDKIQEVVKKWCK